MTSYFKNIPKIEYKGKEDISPLSFKYYNEDQIVLGKPMKEHLRFATCYWHSFTWPGLDPFGDPTLARPWMERGDPIEKAEEKLDEAFNFFSKITTPYFCFHDRDISPEGDNYAETQKNFFHIIDLIEKKITETGVKLLWGTANAFSNKRYMGGASTNPDPEVFAYAAAQVKDCMDATMRLGGQNYVLWGGREGYETILNTNMKLEMDNLTRFLELVVNHKHKIGFKGQILLEPKPHEPTKHQYDFDSASCIALIRKAGLENEIHLNIEVNHATLSGHNFEHEISYAIANNALGSIDINRGDALLGWDTDQFPNNPGDLLMAFYHIFSNGGFKQGGLNFDAKIRRQSIDPEDLFYAHIGGMDVAARTLLAVERMINDKKISSYIYNRYKDWNDELGNFIHNKNASLESVASRVIDGNLDPQPRSGNQELLENIINKYL
jgi:xylose isomerase